MCVCVCIPVCAYACVRACACVFVFAYLCVRTRVSVRVCVVLCLAHDLVWVQRSICSQAGERLCGPSAPR